MIDRLSVKVIGATCTVCHGTAEWTIAEMLRRYQAHDVLVAALEAVAFNGEGGYCVGCFGTRSEGHLSDCPIGNALRLAKGDAS